MLAHTSSDAATDKQWLDENLEQALLHDAPDLADSVLGQCRAASNAGQPEFARELLGCAARLARRIKEFHDTCAASGR
jgi:phage shock protein A